MQTLITGVPGSGKTAIVVQEFIKPMLGTTVKVQPMDGESYEAQRVLYTNIKGLQLPHVLLEAGPVWRQVGKDGWEQAEGNKLGIHNWHEWAKPGAMIVLDEFQRIWPQRPNGAPVPPDVSAMDTHRHGGVDLILLTQKQSFDQHIKGLLGRHVHLRRMWPFAAGIMYEWDSHSQSLLYSKAFKRKPYKIKKSTYELYHSADAHTKQASAIPTLVWFLVAGVVAMGVLGPTFYGRMQERIGTPKKAAEVAKVERPAGTSIKPIDESVREAEPAAVAPPADVPVLLGCVASAVRCVCFGSDGARLDKSAEFCTAYTRGSDQVPVYNLAGLGLKEAPRQSDLAPVVDQDAHHPARVER